MNTIGEGLFDLKPGARGSDPETSHGAKVFHLNEDRVDVLRMHVRHPLGLTDFELADLMGRQQNSVGKRRCELRDFGYIIATPLRRPTPSGASAIVWCVTGKGIELDTMLHKNREELFGHD